MGMDSLMAVEMRNRLQAALGCALPASVIFDYPSVEGLAGHLVRAVLAEEAGGERAASGAGAAEDGDLLQRIEQLSEGEVERLLRAGLDAAASPGDARAAS